MFDEFHQVLSIWNGLDKGKYDSLNVVYPQKRFLLDQNHNPIGFGQWHKYSQGLPCLYQLSWSICILSRKCIDDVSYMVGAHPYWYECYSDAVDINTEDDFELAQIIYERHMRWKGNGEYDR